MKICAEEPCLLRKDPQEDGSVIYTCHKCGTEYVVEEYEEGGKRIRVASRS